ncbi:transthyretin-like family domain-containing protein [Ditylenchus destructor]|nr:transthyretin-like family domain-containing protein [Ditylenchus destructor]
MVIIKPISCLLLLGFCGLYCEALGIGRKQSSGARGVLLCDGKPASGVEVKLYDDDRGIDTDDLMAHTETDSEGHFQLKGFTHEITTIDPKINIYHDCEDGIKPCQRKLSIMLPDKYVSSGENPERIYDLGVLELSGGFKGETRDCIH